MAISIARGDCIDSDILIDYLRGVENARTFLHKAHKEMPLYISAVSIVEIYAGKETKSEAKRTRIERFLQEFQVIPMDTHLAQTAGTLRRDYGKPFADMIVAATAHEYNLQLVTRNLKHFEALRAGVGLRIVKPY